MVPVQVISSGPGWSGDGLLQIMLALINAARQRTGADHPLFRAGGRARDGIRGALPPAVSAWW